MKIKTIFLILLLMPFVLADAKEEEFTIPVNVEIKDWYVNVTVGDGMGTYSCNGTSTNTFNPTIYHNFTYECGEESKIRNFTDSVNKMADNCLVIQEAYKDSSTYYQQYLECKSSLSTCNEAKTNLQKDASLKDSAVSEKDICLRKLTDMEKEKNEFEVMSTFLNSSWTACKTETSGCKGTQWWIGIGGALAGAVGCYYWQEKKKGGKSQTAKEYPKG